MEINKLHDYEIEALVLGSVIAEPIVLEKIGSDWDESVFFKPNHKTIAWAIGQLILENKQIDLVTVVAFLKSQNKLDEVGGAYEISQLETRFAGTFRSIEHYTLLRQFKLLRDLAALGHEMKVSTLHNGADPFEIIQQYEGKLGSLTDNITKYSPNRIDKLNESNIKRLEAIREGKVQSGIYIGFNSLQAKTGGWQRTELIILAARPAMGKTSLALQFLIQPAIKGIPTALFSLEMGDVPIVSRVQSILSGFSASNLLRGNMTQQDIESLKLSTQTLNKAPIYIDSTPAISISEFRRKSRRLKKDKKIELIIVDYLQLMRGDSKQNREQEISSISRVLKEVAKELDVPVIALSQLSREVEKRGDKRPQLSDLRESGAIEQDADMVIFIHRPEYYGQTEFDDGTDARGRAELIISKNRNGALGSTLIGFDAHTVRFHDLESVNNIEPNNSFY